VDCEALLARVFEEGDGCALVSCATCATTAMDVVFQVSGAVEVEDHGQARYVETTSGDGGGDEDGEDALLEVVDGFVAVRLVLGAVDGVDGRILGFEQL